MVKQFKSVFIVDTAFKNMCEITKVVKELKFKRIRNSDIKKKYSEGGESFR